MDPAFVTGFLGGLAAASFLASAYCAYRAWRR